MTTVWILLPIVLFLVLSYKRANLPVWTISYGAYLVLYSLFSAGPLLLTIFLWASFVALAILLNIKPLRRRLLSRYILKEFHESVPALSSTEKEALAAGTVGWDGDLFSGIPNWAKMRAFPKPKLSEEELSFLNDKVSRLCAMTDNWDILQKTCIPDNIWTFLRENGFFGIIIPKKYGGLEFSAYAHSTILTKIAGRSTSVASIVAVPNSLGPAELLLHYGTKEQQDYYLPRLAKGLEIPCFALTGPEAGSDASAMPDYGIVCKDLFEGQETLGIRLNWDKRYITLAPIATVLGLAFKLFDPDKLLGGKKSLGITCALIPTHLAGITIGRRHYPLHSAFPNGPTQGKDVFIPLDYIIGGIQMAGQGWRMLVECLAAGRGISLPSMATGSSEVAAYATGAYARIRNQFHLPIGKFGGVEEALARIAGNTYIMEATRVFTVAALDRGEKPAVQAAISKYHVTELGRKVVNDAMDVHGGKGICMGPRNYLAIGYQETPISITVEGANILTRSMIIFGQGAIRCHPYILKEMQAAALPDEQEALKQFDRAIFAHMGFVLSNMVRTFIIGITNGIFVGAPGGPLKRYYQTLGRFSSALAFVSDVAMISLGGKLKQKEKLSGRLGDVLSMLYLGSAVLKQFDDNGQPDYELPVAHWACQTLIASAQKQLYDALVNFPNHWIGAFLKFWVFPLGQTLSSPNDRLGHKVARLMLNPDSLRSSLAREAYLTPGIKNPVGMMEVVLQKIIAYEPFEKKLQDAIRAKKVTGYNYPQQLQNAEYKGILTEDEASKLLDLYHDRREILAVDDFNSKELEGRHAEEDATEYTPKLSEVEK